MSLLALPNELLLEIAEFLYENVEKPPLDYCPIKHFRAQVLSFSRTNRYLHSLLSPVLHRTIPMREDVLIYAINRSRPDIAELALRNGADVAGTKGRFWRSYGDGLTALEGATRREQFEIVRILLESGAEASPTALISASKQRHPRILELLLANGANASWDRQGTTPLNMAASHGLEENMRVLLRAGADVDKGRPLLHALEHGHVGSARLLLDAGANAGGMDDDAREFITRIRGVRGKKRDELIDWMIKGGANAQIWMRLQGFEEVPVWEMWMRESST